jgi:hypothetical protein
MTNTPYQTIIQQFQKAFEKDLVSTCNTADHYTSITFSQSIKPTTISMLIRILEHRYHSDIFVIIKSPLTIEIWDKGVSF